MTLSARTMTREDVAACVPIINYIIALGGTTAHEDPYTEKTLASYYFEDPQIANVVLEGDRVVGFQAAFLIEPGVYSIGSFTNQAKPVKGAGTVMMEKTKADCRAAGGASIIAKITSDNTGGLAYYSKMGFEDEVVHPQSFTRKDGTVVDRVIKRFIL